MAEFCAQCAKELGFAPDWRGMLSLDDCANGKILGPMLCEGCGPTYIDHRGACVGGCLKPSHGPYNPKYNQQLAQRTIARKKYNSESYSDIKLARLYSDIRNAMRNQTKGSLVTVKLSLLKRMKKALQLYCKSKVS